MSIDQYMIINKMKKDILAQSRKKTDQKGGSPRVTAQSLVAPCAFHPNERITNFCTNRQCLLPLCPKCIKIHTQEHIKMGIFGQFDTIQQSLVAADEGLKYTVQRLSQFQKLVIEIRQSYDTKAANDRKVLRSAKNHFLEEIERIFDQYEKSLMTYEHSVNKEFFDDLYQAEELLTFLGDHCQKALRRLSVPQTVMEGVINYYSQGEEIEKVDLFSESLEKNFPMNLRIVYHPSELDRIETLVKKYLDAGEAQEDIWNHHRQLFYTQEKPKITYQRTPSPPRQDRNKNTHASNRQPINVQYPRADPYQSRRQRTPEKVSELDNLKSNNLFEKFRSPLDNFSLSRLRRERNN